jgi:hypothetical protein
MKTFFLKLSSVLTVALMSINAFADGNLSIQIETTEGPVQGIEDLTISKIGNEYFGAFNTFSGTKNLHAFYEVDQTTGVTKLKIEVDSTVSELSVSTTADTRTLSGTLHGEVAALTARTKNFLKFDDGRVGVITDLDGSSKKGVLTLTWGQKTLSLSKDDLVAGKCTGDIKTKNIELAKLSCTSDGDLTHSLFSSIDVVMMTLVNFLVK